MRKPNLLSSANRRSIQFRFSLWAGLCLTATAGSIAVFSAWTAHTTSIEAAEAQAQARSSQHAREASSQLAAALQGARTLAKSLSAVKDEDVGLDLSRENVNGILEIVLEDNPDLDGVFTCWEPDAFDGLDIAYEGVDGYDGSGRLVTSCRRDPGGEIHLEAMSDYESTSSGPAGGRLGDYYLVPRETQREYASAPFWSGPGEDARQLVRLSTPIVADGTFYGIVGVDLCLSGLQDTVTNCESAFRGSEISIYGHDGTLVARTGADVGRGAGLEGPTTPDSSAVERGEGWLVHAAEIPIGTSTTPWRAELAIPMESVTAAATALMWRQIVLGGVLTGAALLLMWFIAGGMVRPIRQTADAMADISKGEGDLTRRLELDSQDEVAELAEAFNEFVGKIGGLIQEVADCTGTISSVSDEIDGTSKGMLSAASESADRIEQATGSTKDVRSRMEEMALSMDQMSSSIREIADNSNRAATVVRSTSDLASSASNKINALETSAREIESVVELISGIAEQTNLLALNATIEAARAGEAGKGFSVVAIEVKDLADETGRATVQISERIQAIQRDTTTAIESIADVIERISEIDQISQTIAAAVEEQTSTTQRIGSSVQTAADICSGIADSMVAVSTSAESTRDGANQTESSAAGLAVHARTLGDLVGQFRY